MRKSIKLSILFLTFFSIHFFCFSLEVNKSELESLPANENIEFINYSGPHTVINTRNEIKGIGSSLSSQLLSNNSQAGTYGLSPKYHVIHVVDSSVTKGLDADIIVLGKDAGVDHIRNLRWIISSYLSNAYNYSEQDADTLSVFITVYNAVYRENLTAFAAKYKPAVINNLTADSVGLSVNYKDWPGKTQIVIPLYDPASGGLSTIDTSVISDKAVVQSMQSEDGKNIDARKDMVDLKEREADDASNAAIEAQKQAVEAQKQALASQEKALQAQEEADAERKKLSEEQKASDQAQVAASDAAKQAEQASANADNAKQTSDQAQIDAQANPNDQQAQETAEQALKEAEQTQEVAEQAEQTALQAQETADQAKQAAEQQQQAVDMADKEAEQQQLDSETKKEEAVQASANASEKQQLADKKLSESQSERVEIAQDQKTVIAEKENADNIPKVYGLLLIDEAQQLSAIVSINSQNGSLIKQSPVAVIRGRSILSSGDNYAAIAGTTSGNGAIKLVVIDKKNMEIIIESTEQLSPYSVLVQDGKNFLVIIADNASWKLARYDSELKLLNKSTINVSQATPVVISESGISVTSADNQIKLLKAEDLSEIK